MESAEPTKIKDIQASGTSQYLTNEMLFDTVTENRFAEVKQSEF